MGNRLVKNLTDYFGLRRHLQDPWKFVWSRKTEEADNNPEIRFKAGFTVRCAVPHVDRQTLNGIFGRDEYRLNGFADGSFDTVVDVGANIGLFSIRVAPLARRVVAYEPLPDHFKILQSNLTPFRHVLPVRKAVSGSSGPVDLWVSPNPGGHSILPDVAKGTERIRVEAATFREIFAEHSIDRCDLLKIDCEGAEYESLAAMPAELWPRIQRIHLEFHQGPAGWSGDKLAEFLRGHGYRCDIAARGHHPDQGHLFATLR